jgi:two-component system chemotaxis sensor kinase CheA
VNKRVVFEGTGSEIRLDSEVLGGLQAALIQLARNAVVHGIENESARTASGKTGTGKIVFRVARSGRQITFSCTDDGKGIDLERIREVAVRRGLVSADAAVDREELLRMLFRSGVSTTATATEVSGRGVGLDVVQETAQRFGGAVHIETEDGTGTTVSITVPLSVASLEVLLVQDGPAAATIAIPADAVRRTLRLSRHEVRSAADRAGVIVDEKVVPFVGLQDVLTPEATVASWETCFAAVVDGRSGAAAFGVERMIGIAKIVLRPLPAVVPRAPIVAGAAFDAEGNVILILDPDALVAAALNRGDSFSPAAKKSSPARILVVDDSLTTRMLEQSILESAGYDVEIAASAEEALSKTATTAYSLFLVDVEMPGMDGVDFVRTTRQSPGLKNTPAILVTSRSSPEDRQRGLEAGASEYIVKSEFDQARLLQRIRELVK